jgi:hypothetical protein
VINKAQTSVSVVSSANPAAIGQTITFSATVHVLAPGSGAPTGTVTFKDGSTVLGTAGIGSRTATTFTTNSLAAGTHSITAIYSGDTQFIGSTAPALGQVVGQAQPTNIFTTQTPANVYPGPFELGVKFQSSVAGHVTGLRYYRVTGETGTHIGHLWSATGTLLGTTAFTNEGASGWQTASFATPIAVSAHITYVASVNSNSVLGYTSHGLAASVSNGTLSTVADGLNGVYSATKGSFPTSSSGGTNYFRDVVFVTP